MPIEPLTNRIVLLSRETATLGFGVITRIISLPRFSLLKISPRFFKQFISDNYQNKHTIAWDENISGISMKHIFAWPGRAYIFTVMVLVQSNRKCTAISVANAAERSRGRTKLRYCLAAMDLCRNVHLENVFPQILHRLRAIYIRDV